VRTARQAAVAAVVEENDELLALLVKQGAPRRGAVSDVGIAPNPAFLDGNERTAVVTG
jgi:hypothetical protein